MVSTEIFIPRRTDRLPPIGISATPTYGGIANNDHVTNDAFTGTCFVPVCDLVPL